METRGAFRPVFRLNGRSVPRFLDGGEAFFGVFELRLGANLALVCQFAKKKPAEAG